MTASMSAAQRLGSHKYVLLTTYRSTGAAVATPVWVVRDGDALAVWTNIQSGKVKRIKKNPDVAIAPCTARGKPRGLAVAGRAEILDAEGSRRVRQLIKKKYWFLGRILDGVSTRRRVGATSMVGLRINVG